MKLTFKGFLLEAEVKPLEITELDASQTLKILNEHCKKAVSAFHDDIILYRGWQDKLGLSLIDTSDAERASENTRNYYTRLFDTNPENSNWPKRSKSLICTNTLSDAELYGDVSVVFPFDDANIAAVNAEDIWATKFEYGGKSVGIEPFNTTIMEIALNLEDIREISAAKWFLKDLNLPILMKVLERLSDENLLKVIPTYWYRLNGNESNEVFIKNARGFVEALPKFYSFRERGFTKLDSVKNLPTTESEIWFSGKSVCVPLDSKFFELL